MGMRPHALRKREFLPPRYPSVFLAATEPECRDSPFLVSALLTRLCVASCVNLLFQYFSSSSLQLALQVECSVI